MKMPLRNKILADFLHRFRMCMLFIEPSMPTHAKASFFAN